MRFYFMKTSRTLTNRRQRLIPFHLNTSLNGERLSVCLTNRNMSTETRAAPASAMTRQVCSGIGSSA